MPNKSQSKRTPELIDRYLELVKATGLLHKSATMVGVNPSTMNGWRNNDPELDDAVKEALQEHCDLIEGEVFRRSIQGIQSPVFFQGLHTADKVEYSDRLLELYAKRHIPAYRDRHQIEHEFKGGVLVVPGLAISTDAWEKEEQPDGGSTADEEAGS